MRIALFPGSFDPFTIGHKDVVLASLELFDKVIIAVGYNSSKKGLLSTEGRLAIIEESIADLKANGSNIEVISYTGLTVDACRKANARFIIRGVRTTADFEMESVIAQANKRLCPEISTVFLNASNENSFVSSTIVRDIVLNGGDPSEFMSPGADIYKYLNN
ncbi:MAG: pantetheine-phosphate adenylyltransferase [Bacteroidales bacterium]|nr:pantetheine-phosphate adenylyltransferase [Bacteroidales bacterium]MBO7320681.1 pantetheine-phosphate adenylyltransferase [Bacteroidales bacterium]MBO7763768.1 pantetheine-phosphate adenylyltransferase [Bacteroidales bacterium]